jgi:DNA-binding response OmpR family regulator
MAKKILLIDDDPEILEVLTLLLTSKGYEIEKAMSAEQGFDKIVKVEYDMIVLDIMLPGMDGFDLCKKLKDDDRTFHIPVLMLTARAEMADKLRGYFSGAFDYIVKPFDRHELLDKINALFEAGD